MELPAMQSPPSPPASGFSLERREKRNPWPQIYAETPLRKLMPSQGYGDAGGLPALVLVTFQAASCTR